MRNIYLFVQSAGALFLATGLTALLGNLVGFRHLHPHDPLLRVPVPVLFWIFSGVSIAMTWVCLSEKVISFQLLLIGWWSLILAAYQVGACYCASGLGPYLQYVGAAFGLFSNYVNGMLQAFTLYLVLGSSVSLFWVWYRQTPRMVKIAARFQKMSCPACGGHILFNIGNLGKQMPCPHCRAALKLRTDENVKMACFFCKEHIEFPTHAIGTKIACPHCNMDITLKEPA